MGGFHYARPALICLGRGQPPWGPPHTNYPQQSQAPPADFPSTWDTLPSTSTCRASPRLWPEAPAGTSVLWELHCHQLACRPRPQGPAGIAEDLKKNHTWTWQEQKPYRSICWSAIWSCQYSIQRLYKKTIRKQYNSIINNLLVKTGKEFCSMRHCIMCRHFQRNSKLSATTTHTPILKSIAKTMGTCWTS